MIGIQIWAHSYCRSTLAFYRELAHYFEVPLRVCLAKTDDGVRQGLGWTKSEFEDMDIIPIGMDSKKAMNALEEYCEWHQVFGVYQIFPIVQHTILEAKKKDCHIGIFSEAPINLFPPGIKRFAKNLFLRYMLPSRVRPYVDASSYIVNLSGDVAENLVKVGWDPDEIIPCGYFPPPVIGSAFRKRSVSHFNDFHILCTGILTWHRGADLLPKAMRLLKEWGIPCRATVTQSGPLLEWMQNYARKYSLKIDFVGLVPLEELIGLYETCTCYVGLGREEPWGIRVNDSLHCGAPLVISRGMGAIKLINDYDCGLEFRSGNYEDLARKLRSLAEDLDLYLKYSTAVETASKLSTPKSAALRVGKEIKMRFPDWI